MDLLENIRYAIRTVRSNWLRAILTLLIMGYGIMALVGILTAIDSAIYSLRSNLSYLGANSFDIEPKGEGVGRRRGGVVKNGAIQSVTNRPLLFLISMIFPPGYPYPFPAQVMQPSNTKIKRRTPM